MFNQFYIVDNQICEAVIAVYRTKDPSGEFDFSLYFTLLDLVLTSVYWIWPYFVQKSPNMIFRNTKEGTEIRSLWRFKWIGIQFDPRKRNQRYLKFQLKSVANSRNRHYRYFYWKPLSCVNLEFNELKKEVKSGRDVEPKTINEKRRKLWDLMSVPRQKWSLYYIKYRIGLHNFLRIVEVISLNTH